MKEENKYLVLPISNFGDEKRIENYLDYERTYKMLSENELLFVVETNSDFLNIKESDSKFSYNLIHCIEIIGKKYSFQIHKEFENNKGLSRFGGICKGILISVK